MNAGQQRLIDEVMDNFDFAKVAKAMAAVEWTWADGTITDGKYTMSVPDESRIRESARRNLQDAVGGSGTGHHSVSFGGFQAFYDKDSGELSLDFCLADYTAEPELDDRPAAWWQLESEATA